MMLHGWQVTKQTKAERLKRPLPRTLRVRIHLMSFLQNSGRLLE